MAELLDLFVICANNADLKWQAWQNADGAVGFAAAGRVTGILL
jgi:hypothetical protein